MISFYLTVRHGFPFLAMFTHSIVHGYSEVARCLSVRVMTESNHASGKRDPKE